MGSTTNALRLAARGVALALLLVAAALPADAIPRWLTDVYASDLRHAAALAVAWLAAAADPAVGLLLGGLVTMVQAAVH